MGYAEKDGGPATLLDLLCLFQVVWERINYMEIYACNHLLVPVEGKKCLHFWWLHLRPGKIPRESFIFPSWLALSYAHVQGPRHIMVHQVHRAAR